MTKVANDWINCQQNHINKILIKYFDSKENNSILHEAARYAVLNGGKRIRALLVYAAGYISKANKKILDHLAIVFELIHAYSLIHDDLPSMDNDILRRGKPTCHIKFNEAQAILAGDALQADAFVLLSSSKINLSDKKKLAMINILSKAIGMSGMVLGQSRDIESSNKELKIEQLQILQELKTGLLIQAACQIGFIAGEKVDNKTEKIIIKIGLLIGKIYQITDDILDYESNTKNLGKTAGKDKADNKTTFVSLIGVNQSNEKNRTYFSQLIKLVDKLAEKSNHMRELINYIYSRTN